MALPKKLNNVLLLVLFECSIIARERRFIRIDPEGRVVLVEDGKDRVSEDEGDKSICTLSCAVC